MTKIDLSLQLPDDVAREAKEAGLLSGPAVAQLLRAEIRRQAAGRLAAGAARAATAGGGPLDMADLQDEIDSVRKQRTRGN
jgi:hypothetical protein